MGPNTHYGYFDQNYNEVNTFANYYTRTAAFDTGTASVPCIDGYVNGCSITECVEKSIWITSADDGMSTMSTVTCQPNAQWSVSNGCTESVGGTLCATNNCQNGGTCYQLFSGADYYCDCMTGYQGRDCEYGSALPLQ